MPGLVSRQGLVSKCSDFFAARNRVCQSQFRRLHEFVYFSPAVRRQDNESPSELANNLVRAFFAVANFFSS
jgi:hypothetical protein